MRSIRNIERGEGHRIPGSWPTLQRTAVHYDKLSVSLSVTKWRTAWQFAEYCQLVSLLCKDRAAPTEIKIPNYPSPLKKRTLEIFFKAEASERYREQICAYFGLQSLFHCETETCNITLNPNEHMPMYVNMKITKNETERLAGLILKRQLCCCCCCRWCCCECSLQLY